MTARVRFVIACFARSGTHFLESALNRHPDIQCRWEPFNPLVHTPTSSAAEVLDELWRRKGIVGFPAHWEWQGRNEWTDLWPVLRQTPQLRVIHLRRENLLRQYVSKLLLDQTRVHARVVGDAPPVQRPTVRIDVRDMLIYMFLMETSVTAKADWFREKPSVGVTYEELTGRHGPEALARLQHFLDAEVMPIAPLTVKQETRALPDIIENHDEVVAALGRSGWAHFAESDAG